MRDAYHDALDAITDELVDMSRMVTTMMQRASAALLEADREKAEAVIESDTEIDSLNQEVEIAATELIALQQPVATDLRMVVAAMRISATLERMGDLAQHIAKTARMRYPDKAVPANVEPYFREMAQVAADMGAKMGEVLASKDVKLARAIEEADDRMDDLHRQVLDALLTDEPGPVNQAVDVTLLNRYFERYADHVVSVARRVIYLVIGERALN
ncbi:MAG: phosphate signaling complex protein PhoU [Actinomycetes bacterium]